MDYLEAEPLTANKHSSMFPKDEKIILKIPKKLASEIEDVRKQLEKYDPGNNNIPEEWQNWENRENRENWDSFIVHFDNHLYTPLIIWKENTEEIKSVPVKLNEGETDFLLGFKKFLKEKSNLFKNYKVFLLRNLSRKGIGFFLSSGFYPDFIIWIVGKNQQHIIFIDPKGIRNLGNFNDDKIQFCASYIKEIERKIRWTLKSRECNFELHLNAFILSISKYDEIRSVWDDGRFKNIDFNDAKQEFAKYNIIFQEDSDYFEKIFKDFVNMVKY